MLYGRVKDNHGENGDRPFAGNQVNNCVNGYGYALMLQHTPAFRYSTIFPLIHLVPG